MNTPSCLEIRAAIAAPAAATCPLTAGHEEPTLTFDGYPCPSCHTGRLRVRAALAPKRREGG